MTSEEVANRSLNNFVFILGCTTLWLMVHVLKRSTLKYYTGLKYDSV